MNIMNIFVYIYSHIYSTYTDIDTKIASFQRQLNLYGFRRISKGNDQGAYFHPKFIRGRRDIIHEIKRVSNKMPFPSAVHAISSDERSISNDAVSVDSFITADSFLTPAFNATDVPVTMQQIHQQQIILYQQQQQQLFLIQQQLQQKQNTQVLPQRNIFSFDRPQDNQLLANNDTALLDSSNISHLNVNSTLHDLHNQLQQQRNISVITSYGVPAAFPVSDVTDKAVYTAKLAPTVSGMSKLSANFGYAFNGGCSSSSTVSNSIRSINNNISSCNNSNTGNISDSNNGSCSNHYNGANSTQLASSFYSDAPWE